MKLAHRGRPDERSATLAPTMWLMVGCWGFFAMTVLAADPGWWSWGGSNAAVYSALGTNDYAAVNQGQLKQFTARAVGNMNTYLTNATLGIGGAGSDLTTLVGNWSNEYYTYGYSATNRMPSDFDAVNVGQLKYIASLYYGQLTAAGYTVAWPGWLYPNSATDNQMANVGQLKSVFNFDITGTPAAPTNLTVTTQDDGSVEITWQETSPNVTYYTVQRSDDGGTTWTEVDEVPTGSGGSPGDGVDADVNDVTVAAADAGPSGSEFQIIAENLSAATHTSNPSGGQTKSAATTAPLGPSGLTVAPATSPANSFYLTWHNNSTSVDYNVIEGSKDGGNSWQEIETVYGTDTNDTLTPAPNPNYLWIFKVYAKKSGVQSAPSDIVSGDGVDTDLAPHYALIDIAPGSGVFVNDSGQAVYMDTNDNYQFWNGGTSTPINPPSTPSGLGIIASVAGLNNGGTVAMRLGPYTVLDTGYNSTTGNVSDLGSGTWTVGGGGTALSAVANLLYPALYLEDYPPSGEYYGTNVFSIRSNYPIGINDSNVVIGQAHESGNGPVWAGSVAVENSSYFGSPVYSVNPFYDSHGSYLQGGRVFNLAGINNSGTDIGTYQDVTTNDFLDSVAAPLTGFYGTNASSAKPLTGGIPTAINDNGVITGTNAVSTNLIWMPRSGGYNKKLNGPGAYVNNQMQSVAYGSFYWHDYRLANLSDLVSLPTGWAGVGGTAISHDSGIIIGSSMTNSVAHAVLLIPAQIQRDGKGIGPNNNTVVVGQQINLTNMVWGIPSSAVTGYQWHIPGVSGATNDTAFYDYEPTKYNSNYTNLVTPTNYTTNNYINFYWCGDATNLPVSCTEVIYGQTNTVTATLNVQKPSATISAESGIIAVDAGNYDRILVGTNLVIDPATALHFGSVLPGATPGMEFGANASLFPSGSNNATNIIWNQLVNSDYANITTATSALTGTNSGGYDSGNPPDDVYPYTKGNEADDSPGGPSLQTNYTSFTRSFTATMYLMWQPSTTLTGGDKTVTVPLRSWQWHWSGTATNGAPSAGWGLESTNYPSVTVPDVDVTSPPTWTNEAPSAWQYSGSL